MPAVDTFCFFLHVQDVLDAMPRLNNYPFPEERPLGFPRLRNLPTRAAAENAGGAPFVTQDPTEASKFNLNGWDA